MIARVLGAAVVAIGLLGGLVVLAALESGPRVTDAPPADAAAAARARDLFQELQAIASSGAEGRGWQVREETINGALAAGARVLPGLSARAEVRAREVALDASLPVPGMGLWLNLSGAIAASDRGIEVIEARLGRLALPPALVLPGLRLGADWLLGDGLGGTLIDAVARVRTEPPVMTVGFDLTESDRQRIAQRVRAVMSERAGAGDRERVRAHLAALHAEGRRGALPSEGSFLPYLRHVLAAAGEAVAEGGDPPGELRAALFALALYCGDARFGTVVGVDLPGAMQGRRNACTRTGLVGRTDLRQHFVISAGLKAATSATAALGIGELKELLDSGGGTGFSFDDMAANLAGARFAAEALARPPGRWPALAASLGAEADVMPAIGDLPAGLSEAAFRERFGDVESDAYRRMLAEIERRIDLLPLYATPMN